MRLKFTLFAAAAAALIAPPVVAKEPRPYRPSNDWAIEQSDRFCLATRTFTRGEEQIELGYRMTGLGPNHRLILRATGHEYPGKGLFYRVMPHNQKLGSYPADAERTGDGAIQMSVWTILGPKPKDKDDYKKPHRVVEADAWLAEVNSLKVMRGLGEKVIIQTGPLDQVRRNLRNCLDSVIGSWGLDKLAHQNLTELAHPKNSGKWGNWLRYAIKFENSRDDLVGNVGIRLMIDKKGEATGCEVYSVGINRRMADAVCERLVKFGQFEPAKNGQGEAIDSFYQATAVYHAGF